jgi:hypothetical protein
LLTETRKAGDKKRKFSCKEGRELDIMGMALEVTKISEKTIMSFMLHSLKKVKSLA